MAALSSRQLQWTANGHNVCKLPARCFRSIRARHTWRIIRSFIDILQSIKCLRTMCLSITIVCVDVAAISFSTAGLKYRRVIWGVSTTEDHTHPIAAACVCPTALFRPGRACVVMLQYTTDAGIARVGISMPHHN